MVPKFGWYVLVTRPKPPIVVKASTPSVLATICSTWVEHRAGALERGAGRQLHVDAEEPLVLLGDEPGRELAAEETGAHDDHADEQDGQDGLAHEDPRDPDVAAGDPVEHPVEAAEEGPERARASAWRA